MAYQQPYQSQQPMPTMGMQIGGGGNRNALGKPLNSDGKREWSHGFCGCFDECGTFCYACWCPCIVHGKNKQRIDHLNANGTPDPDGGSCCSGACWAFCGLQILAGAGCILECMNRGEVRRRYGIDGGSCGDCMAAWCCPSCDLTQVSREIELEEKSFGQRY
ncbi:HD domain-containing protein [Mycena sanguinolenta]|uniref:HD domain-containing protein n=1 Tax=Mycena sanguinolenta TaxID=230812 RepID=A0A8H6WT30_9AGAR|nr:HD domain-containing protein [Mycena sanguinolenta]